jgi:hypothetical protein
MAWLPKLLSLVFLWGAVAAVLLYVEPELLRDILIPDSYFPFFALLTLATWYTLTLILRSAFYGMIISITLLSALVLLMLQLMHWGLGIALALTLVIESWYIYRNEKIKSGHEQQNRKSSL